MADRDKNLDGSGNPDLDREDLDQDESETSDSDRSSSESGYSGSSREDGRIGKSHSRSDSTGDELDRSRTSDPSDGISRSNR